MAACRCYLYSSLRAFLAYYFAEIHYVAETFIPGNLFFVISHSVLHKKIIALLVVSQYSECIPKSLNSENIALVQINSLQSRI